MVKRVRIGFRRGRSAGYRDCRPLGGPKLLRVCCGSLVITTHGFGGGLFSSDISIAVCCFVSLSSCLFQSWRSSLGSVFAGFYNRLVFGIVYVQAFMPTQTHPDNQDQDLHSEAQDMVRESKEVLAKRYPYHPSGTASVPLLNST